MLSSNKNKLDESMMFHRGVAGGVPDFKNLFSESPIHRVLFAYNRSHPTRAGAPHPPDVPLSVWYEAKGSKHVKGGAVGNYTNWEVAKSDTHPQVVLG